LRALGNRRANVGFDELQQVDLFAESFDGFRFAFAEFVIAVVPDGTIILDDSPVLFGKKKIRFEGTPNRPVGWVCPRISILIFDLP